MEKNYKVSIIVPVYNVENYLERCVWSLLKQTYENIEIILIDDGSTDNSGVLCDRFCKLDNRVFTKHINNQGVSNARNVGISIAGGDYITFVDSDDWLDLRWVELSLSSILLYGSDVLTGKFIRVYSDGHDDRQKLEFEAKKFSNVEFLKFLYGNSYSKLPFGWEVCGKLFKRNLFIGMSFDRAITMGEDKIFFWKLMQKVSHIAYEDRCIYYYYQRENSAMGTMSVRHIQDDYLVNTLLYEDNNWHKDKILAGYIDESLCASRIDYILKLSNDLESRSVISVQRNNIFKHFRKHFITMWRKQKCKGIFRLMVACLPNGMTGKIYSIYKRK